MMMIVVVLLISSALCCGGFSVGSTSPASAIGLIRRVRVLVLALAWRGLVIILRSWLLLLIRWKPYTSSTASISTTELTTRLREFIWWVCCCWRFLFVVWGCLLWPVLISSVLLIAAVLYRCRWPIVSTASLILLRKISPFIIVVFIVGIVVWILLLLLLLLFIIVLIIVFIFGIVGSCLNWGFKMICDLSMMWLMMWRQLMTIRVRVQRVKRLEQGGVMMWVWAVCSQGTLLHLREFLQLLLEFASVNHGLVFGLDLFTIAHYAFENLIFLYDHRLYVILLFNNKFCKQS